MVGIVGKGKKKVEKSHRARVGSIGRSSIVFTRPDASTSLSMTIWQTRDLWLVRLLGIGNCESLIEPRDTIHDAPSKFARRD
jgi:hypothetical protein